MKNHPFPQDRDRAISWARQILNNKSHYAILDTETTGLGSRDVVIEIALIDLNGKELFSSLVKPTKRKSISREATAIHGIRMSQLKECPTFPELVTHLEKVMAHQSVLIYNAEFDEKLIEQTCSQDGCRSVRMSPDCVMLAYSEFKGRWSNYHGNYTFQSLPGGDHSALGDARATLRVIERMAKSKLSKELAQNKRQKTPIDGVPNGDIYEKKPKYIISTQVQRKWWQFWK